MRFAPTVFTDEMDATVRRLAACSLDATARELGVSRQVVSKRRAHLGVCRGKVVFDWTPKRDAELREMAAQKVMVAEQAERFGTTLHVIAARRQKLGIAAIAKSWTAEDSKRAAELYATGMPMNGTGAAMGFHGNTVATHLVADGVCARGKPPEPVEVEEAPRERKSHVDLGDGIVIAIASHRYAAGISLSAGCGAGA